jgi:hypothetical protein
MLHVTMLDLHPQTPTYLLVCAHTWHRTVLDPINPRLVKERLGADKLDLILLTTATEQTLAAAEWLHHHVGAPILAGIGLQETQLPVARYLEDGTIVGLGPLAQTIDIPEGGITCYALGAENVVFTGPLFATGISRKKANKAAMAKLAALPEDTHVCGGGAHNLLLKDMLKASNAS